MSKAKPTIHPIVYDLVIAMLLMALGAVLAYYSQGNNYVNLVGGAVMGAGLATLFSSLSTTRVENKISESLERFDQAIALVQFEFEGSRALDSSSLAYTYQYYKTVTSDGQQRWRLTLYEWSSPSGSYMANGKSKSVDTSGQVNLYSSVMFSTRGSLLIVETDPLSDEPSSINLLRRPVASARLYGIARLTTWKNSDVFTPLILSKTPIDGWLNPDQDEHQRLSTELDKDWADHINAGFLTIT